MPAGSRCTQVSQAAQMSSCPEIPYRIESVVEKLKERYRRGRNFAIAVVSEGACETNSELTYKLEKDAFKEHAVLGGVAERLAGRSGRDGYEARASCWGTCNAAAHLSARIACSRSAWAAPPYATWPRPTRAALSHKSATS